MEKIHWVERYAELREHFNMEESILKLVEEVRTQHSASQQGGMREDTVKQIARIAWMGAANAFRMYPNNKHTFVDYWDAAKTQFNEWLSESPQKEEGEQDEYIGGLKKLLRIAGCPEVLIENPNTLEPRVATGKDLEWAEGAMVRHISNSSINQDELWEQVQKRLSLRFLDDLSEYKVMPDVPSAIEELKSKYTISKK